MKDVREKGGNGIVDGVNDVAIGVNDAADGVNDLGVMSSKIALKNWDTYVYIDVSNIRAACLKTLGLRVDFVKLLEYLRRKYPNLREARYYEGIMKGDEKKRGMFKFLERRGYIICALERKSYASVGIMEGEMECPKCGNKWTARLAKERTVMKSNVDVYLAADMLVRASMADRSTRLILVSCDGDYTEAIKNAVDVNDNVAVAVLATPHVRDRKRNTLSVRLRELEAQIPRYILQDITSIQGLIGEMM